MKLSDGWCAPDGSLSHKRQHSWLVVLAVGCLLTPRGAGPLTTHIGLLCKSVLYCRRRDVLRQPQTVNYGSVVVKGVDLFADSSGLV